jgi:hypothetical protein
VDPVTVAIVAAIAGGVAEKVGGTAVLEGYKKLKALLKKRFGDGSPVLDAVAKVEEDPQSEARPQLLAEEIRKAGADRDEEIVEAAGKLLELLERQPGGRDTIVKVRGNFNATATDHSTATVNVDTRP